MLAATLALGFSSLPAIGAKPVGNALLAVRGAAPANLRLTAAPGIVDVGDNVTLTVAARRFPQATSVGVSFLSAHHGFSGRMKFVGRCKCFQLTVALAKRSHALERARVTATVTVKGRAYVRRSAFQIRGLTPDGKRFSPGGKPYLSSWVSDPQPLLNQYQHYCAWTKALDAFPISGMPVSFVVHYPGRTQRWFAGFTGANGVICSSKKLGAARAGAAVTVDIYAGRLRGKATFTPRKS